MVDIDVKITHTNTEEGICREMEGQIMIDVHIKETA